MDLKELRLEKGWSQEHLSEVSGVSVRTIQRIEKGKKPGLETQKALAAGFDITVSELKDPTAEKKGISNKQYGLFKQVPEPWRRFFIHLAAAMIVITWVLVLIQVFELDLEIAGATGMLAGFLLIFHLIRVVRKED